MHPVEHRLEPFALRVVLWEPTVQVYLSLNLISQLFYVAIIWFHCLGLLDDLHGLAQVLLAVEGLGFSVVGLRVGRLDLDGAIAIVDALLIILQFELGIRPVGVVNVVWLLQCDLDGDCVALDCLVVVLRHEGIVSRLLDGIRIVFVGLLLPFGHF